MLPQTSQSTRRMEGPHKSPHKLPEQVTRQVPEQAPEQVQDLLHTNNTLIIELIKVIGNEEYQLNESGEVQLSAAIKKNLIPSDNCDEQGVLLLSDFDKFIEGLENH